MNTKPFKWDLQLFAEGDEDEIEFRLDEEEDAEEQRRDSEPPDEEEDESTLTADEKLERANAKLKRFIAFEDIVSAVEKDPSRIHDLRGAIAPKKKDDDEDERPTRRREEYTAPAPRVEKTPEQVREERKALSDRIRNAMMDPEADILEVLDPLIDERAERRVGLLRRDAAGILDTTAETFLDRFVSSREDEEIPSVFAAAKKLFYKDTADINPAQMMSLNKQLRERELGYRWDAAVAKVMRSRVKKPARAVSSSGRGVNMTERPRSRETEGANKLSDSEKRVLRAQLPKAEAERTIREWEAGKY